MITEIAIATLAASWFSGFSKHDRSRLLLGKYTSLFNAHGMAWAVHLVDQLYQQRDPRFPNAQRAFEEWFHEHVQVDDHEEAEIRALKDFEDAVGKTIYLTWVMEFQPAGNDHRHEMSPPLPFKVGEEDENVLFPHGDDGDVYPEWHLRSVQDRDGTTITFPGVLWVFSRQYHVRTT